MSVSLGVSSPSLLTNDEGSGMLTDLAGQYLEFKAGFLQDSSPASARL